MIYRYRARDGGGALRVGAIEAADELGAATALSGQGLFPVAIKREKLPTRKLSRQWAVIFWQQLALMLGAGLSVHGSLSLLAEQENDRRARRLLSDLADRTAAGMELSRALALTPGVFSATDIALVKAGEVSGELDTILLRLAAEAEKSYRSRERLRTVMLYPLVLFAVLAGLVLFLLLAVLPVFAGMFRELYAELPLPTRLVLAAGDFVAANGWLLLPMLLWFAGCVLWLWHEPRYRRDIDRLLLKLPLFGSLVLLSSTADLAAALYVLTEGGVPLPEAIAIASPVTGNRYLSECLEKVRRGVEQGRSLSEMLSLVGAWPPLFAALAAVGENVGAQGAVLAKVADHCRFAADARLKRLEVLLEPAMILIVGSLVGFVVLAVIMPLVDSLTVIR